MIGLLDPALLLPRGGDDPNQTFCEEVDQIVRICRERNIRLLPIEGYWDELWSTFGRELEGQLDPTAKRTLQELRKLGSQNQAVQSYVEGVAWRRGFRQLFGQGVFEDDWELRMASAVAKAVSIAEDEENVFLFVRRLEGRNLRIHRIDNSTLDENTRWTLYVQLPVIGPRQVLCVYNKRNITEKWTCRFDWRLPSIADGGKHSFIPPNNWWLGSTVPFRTIRSKNAWIDLEGNGWARPNIPEGAGYHWDVFVNSEAWGDRPADNHVNIVAFGVPKKEGQPGNIHH